jgi:uroporphyrinogen-III synthase
MVIKKILISQPQQTTENTPYADLEKRHGVAITFRQFIKVESMPLNEFRKQGVNIAQHTAVVFNSKVGVDNFFSICQKQRYIVPEAMKYFCISENISNYLQKYATYFMRRFNYPENGKVATNEELVKLILERKEQCNRFLLVLSADNHSTLPALMKKAKCNFNTAYLYRTVSSNMRDVNIADYQMLAFFSPFGIASLHANFPDFVQNETIIACMGATTAKAASDAGLRVDILVPNAAAQSMPDAIDVFFNKIPHRNY